MAAHNPLLVDICYYGTARQKQYRGEIASLIARGTILQRLKEAVEEYEAIIASHDNNEMPFRWS